jgi:E3 ubiquitin-protein ligase RHA2
MDLLSYVRIESENYRGKDPIVVIYVWGTTIEQEKPKKIRHNILSILDLEPFYKCGVMSPNDVKDCAICINKIESNEYIRKLKCNHLFHKKCVDNWLKKNIENASCPMCRSKVNLKN